MMCPPARMCRSKTTQLLPVAKTIGFLRSLRNLLQDSTAMRVAFAIVIAVVAVFTTSGLASASNPIQLQQAVPGANNNVKNGEGSARFLRKGPEDKRNDLASEERGAFGDLVKTAKQYLNGEQKLARMFEKSDEKLWRKRVSPDKLKNAANRLEEAGWPAAKVAKFRAKGEYYSRYYYFRYRGV